MACHCATTTVLCLKFGLDKNDAAEPFLEASFRARQHHWPCILQKEDVSFLMKMVWLLAAPDRIADLGPKVDALKP